MSESYVSLDDYRIQILERLKSCIDPARVRQLLSDVDAMLASTDVSSGAQREFWQGLNYELNDLAHRMSRSPTRIVVSARSVIAAAQAIIAQYQRRLKGES